MTAELARQWFVPGEGIDRYVISAEIQRYLGNDATVRPGRGTGEYQGVDGFWIRAYRNLTSAMIADLRADSARWRKEQAATGTREPYIRSEAFQLSNSVTRGGQRPSGDSPMREGMFGGSGGPPPSRDRPPTDRMQSERMPPERIQADPPIPSQQDRRYAQQGGRPYPQDNRQFPQDGRGYVADGRSQYQQDTTMSDSAYGRPQAGQPYGQDPRYAPSYPIQSNEGPPPGYVRQGNYYVPTSSAYEPAPPMAATRGEPSQYGVGPYGGQPPPPQGRDPRDQMGNRFNQNEYPDPRYAYPSPAATVASVGPREVTSPPQPQQSYGAPPNPYGDQYGRPAPSAYSTSAPPEPGYGPPPPRDPNYPRDRQAPPPADARDPRRRRVH